MNDLTQTQDALPAICGPEKTLVDALRTDGNRSTLSTESSVDFTRIKSGSAVALHMHQPLIPAGGSVLKTAEIISNLDYMMNHQHVGDNHNAPVFHWCYKRMGEYIPALIEEGKQPRVMLDYSGTLLYGLRKMGLHDVFENLRRITCEPRYSAAVEWLGCPWGHAVAPSTPPQDYRLHVRAWQHHFAATFGLEALRRVRGFSPAEMALPNHPDTAYEFVKTLKECGYQWVLVQEHTVERPENGTGPERKHLPHRLVCRNSRGEEATITALIKTQGSEYLEHLAGLGICENDFPTLQPILQKRIWGRFRPGSGPEELGKVIEQLKREDSRFHTEGGSWTNNISWVKGYDKLLNPIQRASVRFFEKVIQPHIPISEPRYRNALFHLLCSQTSCFRYWGEGLWADYGREICRRLEAILRYDF